jgi:hypothetical protein
MDILDQLPDAIVTVTQDKPPSLVYPTHSIMLTRVQVNRAAKPGGAGSVREEACEAEVDALVLVGDVEEAFVVGDRDALDPREVWELAHELAF